MHTSCVLPGNSSWKSFQVIRRESHSLARRACRPATYARDHPTRKKRHDPTVAAANVASLLGQFDWPIVSILEEFLNPLGVQRAVGLD